MKRTHLPLNALRVFDAAARHLSFTRAADELAVTPAAVGQQIRALEETLGVILFRRTTRGLEPTPEATTALPALRAGFQHFEDAVDALQAGQTARRIALATPRAAYARWLAPRLASYATACPELEFALTLSDDPVDFGQANLDLALTFGPPPTAEGVHGRQLAEESLVIVGPPALTADSAAAVAAGPRIDCGVSDWGAFFAAHGIADAPPARLTLADAGLALDAACAGLGLARVPAMLAAGDLAAGRLAIRLEPIPIDAAFWLSAPAPQWRSPKVRALVAHLTGG